MKETDRNKMFEGLKKTAYPQNKKKQKSLSNKELFEILKKR